MSDSQPSHSGLSSAIAQPERAPQDFFSLKGEQRPMRLFSSPFLLHQTGFFFKQFSLHSKIHFKSTLKQNSKDGDAKQKKVTNAPVPKSLRTPPERIGSYLIFVIFFTRTKFLENKIYTEKPQFFALNLLKNATFSRKICRKCQFFALNL